ncbi:hypothetical protein [Candidatus Poriferisodalis sp.]|uniref:hypothetical protein n=1 Tax=Candidatus Poriferisodalis sp. TaxID=3101277 RepID=UPI003B01A61A
MQVTAEHHRILGDNRATDEAEGEQAANHCADELLALQSEMAAAGFARGKANRRIRRRHKTLRQEPKASTACGYWYDEHNFDNDCWEAWNGADTEERVRHLEAVLAGHDARC